MDLFFIEYRDPIFGLIILSAIVFVIAFSSYIWGIFHGRKKRRRLVRFINKFNSQTSLSQKHREMLASFDVDAQTLGLLANAFVKSGDFDKAISVYLIALDKADNQKEKEWALTELGSAYFRAGFLVRAADVFIEALSFRARNLTALRLYVVVCERLRRFDDALEALKALCELGVDVNAAMAYIKAQIILLNRDKPLMQRIKDVSNECSSFGLYRRMCMQAWIDENGSLLGYPGEFALLKDVLDIVYLQDSGVNLKDPDYAGIFYAKDASGAPSVMLGNSLSDMSFEVRALSALKKAKADFATLSFGYVCSSCKASLPMHFYRCPVCFELQSCRIITHLTEKSNENSMPF